jgi:uncharacterized membrane protein (DUF485 family)
MENEQTRVHEILESEKFKMLVKKRTLIIVILTLLMLVVYFGFILIIAFDKPLLATKIGEHITLGLPVGLGVILFAWILTGIYIKWANNSYDNIVNEIKEDIHRK